MQRLVLFRFRPPLRLR